MKIHFVVVADVAGAVQQWRQRQHMDLQHGLTAACGVGGVALMK